MHIAYKPLVAFAIALLVIAVPAEIEAASKKNNRNRPTQRNRSKNRGKSGNNGGNQSNAKAADKQARNKVVNAAVKQMEKARLDAFKAQEHVRRLELERDQLLKRKRLGLAQAGREELLSMAEAIQAARVKLIESQKKLSTYSSIISGAIKPPPRTASINVGKVGGNKKAASKKKSKKKKGKKK